jgi:hypothetical protein
VTEGIGVQVANIDYAGDFAVAEDDLLRDPMMMDKVAYSPMVGLTINPTKTKVMCANAKVPSYILLDGNSIEQVK